MTKKLIDIETGYIHFENGSVVKKDDSLEFVKSLKLGKENSVSDMQTGWFWLHEVDILFNGDLLYVCFGFFNDQLKEIDLTVHSANETKEERSGSYKSKDWHEKRYERFKAWVKEQVGDEVYFDWGTCSANFGDYHEWYSGISINYLKTKRLPDETMLDWEKRMKKREKEELS